MRCFLTKPTVENCRSLLMRMKKRASVICRNFEKKKDEEGAAPWNEEREEVKQVLCALDLVLMADPPTPHYRPQSRCPVGFERKIGSMLRRAHAYQPKGDLNLLTDDQYTVLCNVWCQALDEMLEKFDKRSFQAAAGILETANA